MRKGFLEKAMSKTKTLPNGDDDANTEATKDSSPPVVSDRPFQQLGSQRKESDDAENKGDFCYIHNIICSL